MLTIAQSIFNIPPSVKGLIVEAGAYKGGSTAKLSLIANAVGRKLVVFDSFQGIPPNQEIHINVNYPKKYIIPEGLFYGSLAEVKKNVKTYGSPEVCIFKKGWFDKTLPLFNQKIVAIFLDVDLAASTRICLKYLYPRLQPGGILYSHDGFHILVTEVYQDKIFWKRELGLSPPLIYGIGKQKLIKIIKSK